MGLTNVMFYLDSDNYIFREEPDELFKDLPAVEDLSSGSEDEK
jgi:hypothetical protein